MNEAYFPEENIKMRRSISGIPIVDRLSSSSKRLPI